MRQTPHGARKVCQLIIYLAMKDNQILPACESASTPLQSQTNPPHHILMVEDDIFLRQLNPEVRLRSGYEVDAAAWEALRSWAVNTRLASTRLCSPGWRMRRQEWPRPLPHRH